MTTEHTPLAPTFVLIGAGSVCFGAGTVADLLHFKQDLPGATITLVDIDAEVLALMTFLANRMNDEAGRPFTIRATTDRREALPGADFVVTSFAIKREELWEHDWNAIKQAGIKQTYGENGGPGALFLTLRNVPLMLEICRDIEALAPEAWVINFTNPEARMCMALDRYTNLKFVGLCHQIWQGYHILSRTFDIPVGDLDVKAAGLNHFTWMYDIRRQSTGEDLYPRLRQCLAQGEIKDQPLSCRMFELTGLFPTAGDHHLAEFLPFAWEYLGLEGRDFPRRHKQKAENIGWLKGVKDGTRRIDEKIKGLSGERIVHMAVALLHNRNAYEISMDVRNNGAIPNLPDDAIVETPGVISAMGITPLRMPPLPDTVVGFARRQIEVHELSVEAAVEGSYDKALRAMVLDPVVESYEAVRSVLDDLLEAHRPHISPNFFRR